MQPMMREYLIYAIAVTAGFAAYMVLDHVFKIDFSIALLLGFVVIHGCILLGRRFLR